MSYSVLASYLKIKQMKPCQSAHIFVNIRPMEGFGNTFMPACIRRATLVSFSVDPRNLLVDRGYGVIAHTEECLAEVVSGLIVDGVKPEEVGDTGYDDALKCHALRNFDDILPLFNRVENRSVS